MERTALILAALLMVVPASAMDDGGSWYNRWYQQWSKGEERFEQRQQQVESVEETRCQAKIRKYREKHGNALVDDPEEKDYLTRYYGWKLDSWLEKCKE